VGALTLPISVKTSSRSPAAVLGDELDAEEFEERLVDQLRTITRVPIAARV